MFQPYFLAVAMTDRRRAKVRAPSSGRSSAAANQPFRDSVGVACRFAVDLNRRAAKIDDPDFRHAKLCVKRKLHAAVIGERGFGDLDEEEDVGRARMAALIVVRPRLEEHVRFGLIIGVEAQPALHADKVKPVGRDAGEKVVEAVRLSRVRAADGRLVEDLPPINSTRSFCAKIPASAIR